MSIKIANEINTYLSVGKDEQEFIGIFAKSGYGKSLFVESLMEEYSRLGFKIIILNDVKDSIEMGFAMFKPRKKYHLDHLRKIGKPIETKKVKIFHPFTFNLPNSKIPDFNIYGFSLKNLNRNEWSLISESPQESETIRLLLNASNHLGKSEGIYSFLHGIEETVIGIKKGKSELKANPKLFHLRITPSTAKGLQEVASYLLPFQRDYFLLPEDSELQLDWKEILNDTSSYALFTTKYIKDDKLKQFCILSLLEEIVRNIDYAKKPICIVINEIRFLTPERCRGFQEFLANAIRKRLSVLRNMGRGVSGIFDSQVWLDVEQSVKSSFTKNFFGELASANDIEKLSKALKYRRDMSDKLKHMDVRNSYILQGYEDEDPFVCWFPGHGHNEPEFSFYDEFKKHFPERMKSYKGLKEKMKKKFSEEENKVKEKIKRRERKSREEKERLAKEKEERADKNNEQSEKSEQINQLKGKLKEEKMKRVWEIKQENPKLSNRKIGLELGLNHVTVKNYLEKYQENLDKEKEGEEKVDFEDKVLSETKVPDEKPLLGEDFELPEG